MQLDVGFGDIVYPSPEKLELPSMLGFPASRLLCYSRESSIAEKFEAMVKLGILNSRMKDFYDIWLLSRQFDFEGARLAEAMRLTFERRGTILSEEIDAFQEAFIVAQQMHWAAFCKRLEQNPVPARFEEIVFQIEKFLSPVVSAVLSGQQFSKRWAAANSWN